jgi:hypothetical protein
MTMEAMRASLRPGGCLLRPDILLSAFSFPSPFLCSSAPLF